MQMKTFTRFSCFGKLGTDILDTAYVMCIPQANRGGNGDFSMNMENLVCAGISKPSFAIKNFSCAGFSKRKIGVGGKLEKIVIVGCDQRLWSDIH